VRGEERTGALLLVFRKEKALSKHGGNAVAELLRGAVVQSRLVHPLSVKGWALLHSTSPMQISITFFVNWLK